MNWEQVRDRPIGHVWECRELLQYFEAVQGGVAYPGKRPGFAIVAGLLPVYKKDHYEIHVLDEVESPDLGELLRQCRSLIPKYHTGLRADERFRWYGDYRNTAGQKLIREINAEGRPLHWHGPTENELCIHSVSQVLDMQQPYSYMLSKLKEYMAGNHKQLFLRGSKVQHSLQEVRPDEVFDLAFGAYPAIEALAFAVIGLREHAERVLRDRMYPPKPQVPYDPMDYV